MTLSQAPCLIRLGEVHPGQVHHVRLLDVEVHVLVHFLVDGGRDVADEDEHDDVELAQHGRVRGVHHPLHHVVPVLVLPRRKVSTVCNPSYVRKRWETSMGSGVKGIKEQLQVSCIVGIQQIPEHKTWFVQSRNNI